MPKAVITGITGQDGSYLTELLLPKGYEVHGIVRRASMTDRPRLDHLTLDSSIYGKQLYLHYADLEDTTSLRRILSRIEPDEVYHFAGQSHVGLSFEIPESTSEFTAMGTLRILEILRDLKKIPKFLNVGSSEIFGRPEVYPQTETTPMSPINPYGVAKAFAVQMTRVYRNAFGLFCCNAICYNHESPRRGLSFVTRKITHSAAKIKLGIQSSLELGNLETSRDWGFAGDYVDAMWRILQKETPGDYILATGKLTSLKQFLTYVFEELDLDWQNHVVIDSKFFRPVDSLQLVGDPSNTTRLLGWSHTVNVQELAQSMVRCDLRTLAKKKR